MGRYDDFHGLFAIYRFPVLKYAQLCHGLQSNICQKGSVVLKYTNKCNIALLTQLLKGTVCLFHFFKLEKALGSDVTIKVLDDITNISGKSVVFHKGRHQTMNKAHLKRAMPKHCKCRRGQI